MNRFLTVTLLVSLILTTSAAAGWTLEYEEPGHSADERGTVLHLSGAHWFDHSLQKRLSAKTDRRLGLGVFNFLDMEVQPYALRSESLSPETFHWFGANARLHTFSPWAIHAEMAYGTAEGSDHRDPSATALTLGLEVDLNLFTPELFMLYQSGAHLGKQTPHTGFGQSNPVLASAFSLDLLPPEMLLAPMQGVGLRFKNIPFMNNLSNYLSVVYATGLIDSPVLGSSFGSDDAMLGLNMDAQYALFEQLAALIEVGVLKMYPAAPGDDPDADWKFSLGFRYDF
jgi:hypothetical protein